MGATDQSSRRQRGGEGEHACRATETNRRGCNDAPAVRVNLDASPGLVDKIEVDAIAGTGDRIYLDLVDEAWRCVEIDANGWRIIAAPPVRFRRSAGMLPLPSPLPAARLIGCAHSSMFGPTSISFW